MTFEELKKQLKEDLDVNDENMFDKSMRYSSIYHKYIDMYYSAIKNLSIIKIERDKIYGELFHLYKTGKAKSCEGYDISTKSEIDIYIKKEPQYCSIQKKYATQEARVKFLEMSLENINKMSYAIKNAVEIKKLQLGI